MKRIILVIGCLGILVIVFASNANATPITYNSIGNGFTDFSTCGPRGNPKACGMNNIFKTHHFVIAGMTPDESGGTSAAGLTPAAWAIRVRPGIFALFQRSSGENESHASAAGCTFCDGGSFDLSGAAVFTNWFLIRGRPEWLDTPDAAVFTSDAVLRDSGVPNVASSGNDPETWATPEPTPLLLLGFGLVAIVFLTKLKSAMRPGFRIRS